MGRISIRIFNNPDIGGYYHRKAVNILDSSNTSLPTGTSVTIDGYQISDGDRVLFTNLSDSSLNSRVFEADLVDRKIVFKLARDGRASNGDTLDGDTLYVYFGSHKGELWTYDGGNWVQLDVDILESDDIKRDGTAGALADIPWGGNKLTNLGNPTDPTDAANKSYVDAGIAGITEQVEDTVAALIQNGTGLTWTYNDLANTLTGNVSLSPFSTSDLAEGSNLYYTNERVDDRVAALIQNGTGISWTYNDGLNTLQANISLSPFSTTDLAEGSNLYYTQARFNSAFSAKSTSDLSEGSNLYFTNERVDDRVAALIIDGPGVSWSYNDGANTLQASVSLSGFSTDDLPEGSTNLYFTNERVDDRVAALIQNGMGIQWTYNDGANTLQANVSLSAFSTSDLTEGSNLYYTDERVDDRVSALVQNGTGLTWTYNDILNTFTGNVSLAVFSTTDLAEGSNLYFTDERAQDAIGAALLNSSSLTWSYNDASNQISAVVVASGITHGGLSGLSADDHPQYVLLAGRAGGQTVNGGNAASENLVLSSTSNPTKGEVRVVDHMRMVGAKNFIWDTDGAGNIGTSSTNRPGKVYTSIGLGIGGADPDSEERIKIAGSSSNHQLVTIVNSHSSGEAGYKAANDLGYSLRLVTLGSAQTVSGLLGPNTALLESDSNLTNGLIVSALGKISLAVGGDAAANEILRLASGNAQLMNTANLLWNVDGNGDIGATGANRPNNVYIKNNLVISNLSGVLKANSGTVAGNATTSDLPEGSNLYYSDERVDDRVAALIQNGTGLTWTYNDVLNTFTGNISLSVFSTTDLAEGSNLYFTDERAQDAVAAALTDTSYITWTYNDSLNTIVANLVQSAIDHGTISGLSDDDHAQYFKVLGRNNESLTLTGTANILWDTDGGGDIGQLSTNRPNNAYFKGSVYVGGTDVGAALYVGSSGTGGTIYMAGGSGDATIAMGNSAETTIHYGGGIFEIVNNYSPVLNVGSGTAIFSRSFSLDGSSSLLWEIDGGGNIGNAGNNRPDKLYLKSQLIFGAYTLVPSELGFLDDAEALSSVNLLDNTNVNAVIASWDASNFTAITIEYSLNRGSGNREIGTIKLTTDGTIPAISVGNIASLGSCGVTFDVDIDSGNIRLLYTSTNTGTNIAMKYNVQKWLA